LHNETQQAGMILRRIQRAMVVNDETSMVIITIDFAGLITGGDNA
jgi:hypothetical protein